MHVLLVFRAQTGRQLGTKGRKELQGVCFFSSLFLLAHVTSQRLLFPGVFEGHKKQELI